MTLTQITFSEIQTSNLLYYDPDFKDTCLRFCQERDIDCLPSLDDPLKFLRKTENGLSEEKVTPERMVDSQSSIFEKSLLERFRINYLLFVYHNQELTGVVHFSDYNRPTVHTYLFNMLSDYERSLRKLLSINDLRNQDMLDYFQRVVESTDDDKRKSIHLGKLDEYERHRARNEKLPIFESFYLLDFIELARHRNIIKLSQDVNNLRNMVMHAHDLVYMYDATRSDYIYDFTTFETFFKRGGMLLQDYKKVNNKIAFSEFAGD